MRTFIQMKVFFFYAPLFATQKQDFGRIVLQCSSKYITSAQFHNKKSSVCVLDSSQDVCVNCEWFLRWYG